jgi:hypothetical protein
MKSERIDSRDGRRETRLEIESLVVGLWSCISNQFWLHPDHDVKQSRAPFPVEMVAVVR